MHRIVYRYVVFLIASRKCFFETFSQIFSYMLKKPLQCLAAFFPLWGKPIVPVTSSSNISIESLQSTGKCQNFCLKKILTGHVHKKKQCILNIRGHGIVARVLFLPLYLIYQFSEGQTSLPSWFIHPCNEFLGGCLIFYLIREEILI